MLLGKTDQLHAERHRITEAFKTYVAIGRLHFLTWLKSSRLDLSQVTSLRSKYLLRPEVLRPEFYLNLRRSMYLDHTFARKTFAQRIGSAKVKSKSEVAHCPELVCGGSTKQRTRARYLFSMNALTNLLFIPSDHRSFVHIHHTGRTDRQSYI